MSTVTWHAFFDQLAAFGPDAPEIMLATEPS